MTVQRVLVTSAKRALLRATLATGGFAPFRLANARNGLVLMYHRFGEQPGERVVSAEQFTSHLRYLTARYSVVSMRDLAAYLASGGSRPRPLVAITIDDGHADAYDVAFPVLKRFGVPATLFVVTGFLDGTCCVWTDQIEYMFDRTRRTRATVSVGTARLDLRLDDERARSVAATLVTERMKRVPEPVKNAALDALAVSLDVEVPATAPPGYAPVTWSQVHELERHGVTIEAHTVTHPILTNVSSDQLAWEMTQSKARLERELQRTVGIFCYPNGDCTPEVRDAVQRAGYSCAVLSAGGLSAPGVDPFSIRRVGAAPDLARFAKETSGFEWWQTNLWRPREELRA